MLKIDRLCSEIVRLTGLSIFNMTHVNFRSPWPAY